MSLVVRNSVPADSVVVCDLVRRSITELCVGDHHSDEPTIAAWLSNKTKANFAAWISSPRHVAITAELTGVIAGFALLNSIGTIALLYVAPEARFRGVSKAMLAALEDRALASGIRELKLESTATALAFYERCGYVPAGARVQGFGVTLAHPLTKRLAP